MTRYFKHNKLLAFCTLLFSLLSSLAYVMVAVFLQKILDAATNRDINAFWRILVFSLGYFVLMGALMYANSFFGKKLVCRITRLLRTRTFDGITSYNMEDFTKADTADYLSALTNDVKLVEDNYLLPLMEIMQYGVIFAASLVLMLFYDLIVTACVMVSILLMFTVPGIFGSALEKRQERYSGQLSGFTGNVKDFLSGFEVIRSYGIKKFVVEKFEHSNKNITDAKFSVDKMMAANEAVSMFLAVIVQIVVLFLSAYFVMIGRITAGTLLAMVQVSGNLSNPLLMIFSNVPKLKGVKPVIERLNAFADYENKEDGSQEIPAFCHDISIEGLSFSYDDEHPVLQDISLVIEKGKKYALVGTSGCGKTTLMKLLTGYYSNYHGSIRYDSFQLSGKNRGQVVKLSSMIHQNVYMFQESIQENICLHQCYDEKELQEAIRVSGVDKFLPQTSQGLASPVGENGANLSGGQRQRIAVARAVIRKKPLLILDEGTSAVDMQTAYDIESRLLKVDALTLLTITHNMQKDILERYDEIIYMEEGKIIEKDTFGNLVKKQGRFFEFFQLKK